MRNNVDKFLGLFLALLMSLMVVNVLWQVISRYILGSPSVFTDELATFMLIWVGLLGAAYATGHKRHLAIDILPNQLEGDKNKLLGTVISVFVIVFAGAVMVIGGLRLVFLTLSLEQLSATLRVPLGYIYFALPLSGILIIYYTLSNLKNIRHGIN
jgi:TRAP-type C4-dicarboxylate transport system permease small subunit